MKRDEERWSAMDEAARRERERVEALVGTDRRNASRCDVLLRGSCSLTHSLLLLSLLDPVIELAAICVHFLHCLAHVMLFLSLAFVSVD
jgi:hypothetical protein